MDIKDAIRSIEEKNILRPLSWLESLVASKIWQLARSSLVSELLQVYSNKPYTFDILLDEHRATAKILRKNIQ